MSKFLLFIAFMLTLVTTAHAQQSIHGSVTDASTGDPIVGATIIVTDTKSGTVTDVDGNFNVNATTGQKIAFSYLGKKTVTTIAKNGMRIKLYDDTHSLNDVVVVAYGTQQRHDLTGSISSINSSTVTENPVTSLEQALEGKMPGVQVTQGSGMPGSGISIQVRGASSISAGNEPLYVVDGFPILSTDLSSNTNTTLFNGNNLSGVADIDPNDIESIEVLKDASASALYGSRASNGVVLITTKKGRAGKTRITFDTYIGWQDIPHMVKRLGAQEQTDAYNEARSNYNTSLALTSDDASYLKPINRHDENADTDWLNELTRNALQMSHQLAISGGSDRTQYYVSGGYLHQNGVIENMKYQRYNLRSNVSSQISKRIHFDANVALSYAYDLRTLGDNNGYSPWYNALRSPSDYPVYNEDGTYSTLPGSLHNPLGLLADQKQENKKYRAIVSLKGLLNILPGLDYQLSLNGDYNFIHEYNWFAPTSISGQRNNGSVNDFNLFSYTQLMEHNLTYKHSWKQLDFGALLGYSYQKTKLDDDYVSGINFLSSALRYLDSAGSINEGGGSVEEHALSSFYGRVNFSLLDRYLLEVSLRADRSSKFAPDHRTGWFPAVSAGWHISQEPWFPKNNTITNLKLRASIGKTGNQEGIGSYEWQKVYRSTSAYDGNPGLTTRTRQANENLTWEKTTQYGVGVDLALLRHRIDITLDWYRKNTKDLLLTHSINGLTGYSTRTDNVGSLYNTGLELGVTSHNLTGSFKWDTHFAFSWNKNKITSLYQNDDITEGSQNIMRVGEPMMSFYLIRMDGIYQSKDEILAEKNGQRLWDSGIRPGDVKYFDANDDGVINSKDRVICGSPFPKVFGSIGNTFSYKGFDLNIDLQYSLGAKIFAYWKQGVNGLGSLGASQNDFAIAKEEWEDRWTESHHSNSTPRAVAGGTAASNNYRLNTTRFLENADFLRIRNITLGYTLPEGCLKKMGISRLRFYATVMNLYTFTGYDGFDPQSTINPFIITSRGYDNGALPRTRSWVFGMNLAF